MLQSFGIANSEGVAIVESGKLCSVAYVKGKGATQRRPRLHLVASHEAEYSVDNHLTITQLANIQRATLHGQETVRALNHKCQLTLENVLCKKSRQCHHIWTTRT